MNKQVRQAISSIEELVAAREGQGLSADDICLQLKLAPRQLLALEAGDWAALPGLAFIRAVLRAYGRLLQVDVSPLVDTLPSSVAPADLRPAVSLDEPMRSGSMLGFSSGGSGSRFAWLLLSIVGMIALALFFGGASLEGMQSWLSRDDVSPGVRLSSAPVNSATVVAAAAMLEKPSGPVAAGADATLGAIKPGDGTESSVAAGAPVAAIPGAGMPSSNPGRGGAVSAPGSSAEPATTAGAQVGLAGSESRPTVAETRATPASVPRLRLKFSAESWIEVRAADGAILATGIQPPGSERDINTAGGLSLIIGNAHAVSAQLNGEPFDLTVHTRSTVARFTLP